MPFASPTDDAPPSMLTTRMAYVQLDKLATFRFCGDPKDPTVSNWLTMDPPPGPGLGAHPIREGNEVIYLVDGFETYSAMTEVLQATGRGAAASTDFIYMLNWVSFSDMILPTKDATLYPAKSLRDHLKDASSGPGGAQVCALVWAQADPESRFANNDTASFIKALTQGSYAMVDNKTPIFGSHHQKVLVVKNSNGLYAFCGGVDFNPDRLYPKGANGAGQKGGPMHDVHCRVKGPAANDILQTFVQRWGDAVAFERAEYAMLNAQVGGSLPAYTAPAALRGASAPASPKVPGARLQVQMGRTFANGANHHIDHGAFTFAPQGEQTTLAMLTFAISKAKRYIYIEDQYLVSMDISRALASALSANSDLLLMVLIPHSDISDLTDAWDLRKNFITPLRSAGGERARIYVRKGWDDSGGARAHSYVHAKTWMFDDKLAVIGSTNCNLRGYTYDAEIGVGIFDEGTNARVSMNFAHRMRVKLWAEHTGLGESDTAYALLADPWSGSAYWEMTRSRATRYDENAKTNWTTGAINHFGSERDGR